MWVTVAVVVVRVLFYGRCRVKSCVAVSIWIRLVRRRRMRPPDRPMPDPAGKEAVLPASRRSALLSFVWRVAGRGAGSNRRPSDFLAPGTAYPGSRAVTCQCSGLVRTVSD
jgi:hypothetical protein